MLLLVTTIVFACTENDTMFLHFGPSHSTIFGGIRVDTWGKWALVMTYSCLSQAIESVVSNTLSPYIKNVIQDHKTSQTDKPRYMRGQLLIQIYTLYAWLSSVFDVFLWVTLQVQYMLPAMVADLCLTFAFSHGYLTRPAPNVLLSPLPW